ncbi:MAG: hypothetical protein AAF183_14845 [Pseudomonadota bacterium]
MTGRPFFLARFDAVETSEEGVENAEGFAASPDVMPEETETSELVSTPAPQSPAERALERVEQIASYLAKAEQKGLDDLETGQRWAAEAFGRSAAAALPSLVETGFAAEVACATLDLARALRPRSLVLHLAPEDLEAVETAITLTRGKDLPEEAALRLAADARVAPGEAALRWDGGGAEIEVGALTRAALLCLDRALEADAANPNTPPING